ncbi:MAG: hypothetical protein QE263_08885 [Vampirovibrionales bacterium]|nr:hypothetical protein [Vampirovibrionales bacterium]
MRLWNTIKPLWRAIKTSPATTPAVLMAWGIPTVCVPLFRFLDDQKRPFHDRLMLSIRDLAAYAVGWGIFLVITPSVQFGLAKATQRWAHPWTPKRVGLVSTAIGCILASTYSGFGAKRLAEWMTQRWFQPTNNIARRNDGLTIALMPAPKALARMPFNNRLFQTNTLSYRPLLFQQY